MVHNSCQGILITLMSCSIETRIHVRLLYGTVSPVHLTCTPYLYNLPAHLICTPYLYTLHAHYTCTPYQVLHTLFIHPARTLNLYTLCVHLTYTPLTVAD